MIAYIKSRSDFKNVLHTDTESYSLYTATSNDDSSSVVLSGEIKEKHKGDWLYLAGRLWLISEVKPSEGRTTLMLKTPENAFDRQTEYGGSAASIGAFIKARLTSEYKNQTDAKYAMPYLEIENADNTSFISPVIEGGLFGLADYIKSARRSGVWCDFSISGTSLKIRISTRAPESHSILFDGGRAQLISRSFSRNVTEKVTVYPEGGTAQDFYLKSDGSISTEKPSARLNGEWTKIAAEADAIPMELAAEEFEKNVSSYKIEFYSEKLYKLFDRVRLRFEDGVFEADITAVRISSADKRYYYRCGNLPVTLTEQFKAQDTSGSGRRSSSSAVRVPWYEVGDIFVTTRQGDPRDLLGYGTWQQIKDRFLLAAGDTYAAGATGGSKTRTLTENQIPPHSHTFKNGSYTWLWGVKSGLTTPVSIPGANASAQYATENELVTDQGVWYGTNNTGGGRSFSIMPPYIAVFVWIRTS